MLRLYRKGVIVDGSFNNMREEAVDQLEKWVMGWIHRQIICRNLEEEERHQLAVVQN
jgi:hypothetical protein